MGIINTHQSPVVLTTTQAQTKLKTTATAQINQVYRMNVTIYNSLMNSIWQNADGLTPQQAFDSFGTDAGELVTYGHLLAGLINNVTPDAVSTITPEALTVNENGTVTANEYQGS